MQQIKTSILIMSFFGSSLLCGCGEDEPIANADRQDANVTIISSPTLQIDEGSNDPYEIVSATPLQDAFEIVVQYSGGCEDHTFELSWDHVVAKSFPGQTWMDLTHNANGDACEAFLTDTLMIPYAEIDGFVNQDIIVYINNPSNDVSIAIDSRATDLITAECTLEVVAENAICGPGLWSNVWLSLPESFDGLDKVWLRPLKGNDEIRDVEILEGQTYTVKVKPIFGYAWSGNEINCLALPAGRIVPIEVLCLE